MYGHVRRVSEPVNERLHKYFHIWFNFPNFTSIMVRTFFFSMVARARA